MLRILQSAEITVWLDGGWGVDALLQTQTRPDKDMDIILQVSDVPKLIKILENLTFTVTEGTPLNAFVLVDERGLKVDVHAVTFDHIGNGIHRMDTGGDWIFTPEAFTGQGMIDGMHIHSLSPLAQVKCHAQGYHPTQKDLQDLELLQQCFNIALSPELRRK